ncbi:hypothetical protein MKX03_029324 [Papaver bracteatum]|nr:hypothetical protein MKX03_029324 [Papaver bracteatum]
MQTEPGLDNFVHSYTCLRSHRNHYLNGQNKILRKDMGIILSFFMMQLGFSKMQKLLFMHRKTSIRIPTGQEEAYYRVLDLGGSSLQVLMEIKELTDDRNSLQLKFGSVQHQILAYSLSRFGLNEPYERRDIMFSEEISLTERLQLRHPCLSLGFVLNHSCDGCTYSNLMSSPHPVSRFHAFSGFFAIQYARIESKRFCFPGDAEINFGPGDVSWTLGAALVEGEHKWLSNKEPQTGSYNLKLTKVIPYPISLFIICLCLVLIVYLDRVRQTSLLLVPVPGKKGASTGASMPSYFCSQRQLN